VSQRDPEDTLPHELQNRVLHPHRVSFVEKARSERAGQPCLLIDLAQQRQAAVRRDWTRVEGRRDVASTEGLEGELSGGTLCAHRAFS
jgi:hypothetical protein